MKVINDVRDMRRWTERQRLAGRRLALVPTMGYLHEGHLSLIRLARQRADVVVVSIFVNPTQFAPNEDLDRYPRDFERDEALCRQEGVDAVFYPSAQTMYPPHYKTYVITEDLSRVLCGKSRPSHFRGVTTIVAKLFNIVRPHLAVFGQKDAQQLIIIKKMTADLNFDIDIIGAPIVREADGLAMSSRNAYLNKEERQQATVLYKSLQLARREAEQGNRSAKDIKKKMTALIESAPLARIDYVELVDTQTLTAKERIEGETLAAVAVFFGKTRLIDNTVLNL
ncbi:MAG TPA: pantoate--beta-alanine ligase [Caldithrix abyssi]|uniref:Pantothenate synthetase n=1 Tax=Caldithrix abyssi TaxID=187145 RepID=A0A7V4U434_CALAY|nr:pantoate--beta-alanine ligase [Caldithrix abyssi]